MGFDIKKFSYCFKTEKDQAYFWHGITTNDERIWHAPGEKGFTVYGGQNNAMKIADENNGKTLERCMLDYQEDLEKAGVKFEFFDNGELMSISYGDVEETQIFFDECSESFAKQASGNVHVIEGEDLRYYADKDGQFQMLPEEYYADSTWNRKEHPKLQENPDVDSIIQINSMTGEETGNVEEFDRSNENPDKQSNIEETKSHEPTHEIDNDYYNGMGM